MPVCLGALECIYLPVCVVVCMCVPDLALALVQGFDGKCVGSYVDDHAQLEPVGGVGSPHWLPVLHGSPVSTATQQALEGSTEEREWWSVCF